MLIKNQLFLKKENTKAIKSLFKNVYVQKAQNSSAKKIEINEVSLLKQSYNYSMSFMYVFLYLKFLLISLSSILIRLYLFILKSIKYVRKGIKLKKNY